VEERDYKEDDLKAERMGPELCLDDRLWNYMFASCGASEMKGSNQARHCVEKWLIKDCSMLVFKVQ